MSVKAYLCCDVVTNRGVVRTQTKMASFIYIEKEKRERHYEKEKQCSPNSFNKQISEGGLNPVLVNGEKDWMSNR